MRKLANRASCDKRQLTEVADRRGRSLFPGPSVLVPSLLVTMGVLLLTLSGCTSKTTQAPEQATPAPAYGQGSSGNAKPELFTVPPEQMGHVQVVPVKTSPLRRVLRLTGTVAYNNFETTPVITQVGGHVTRILVSPGETVRAEQPMLYVASPDYTQARTSYIKARDAFALADKNYSRAKDLYAHHAIAEADLITAESARTQSEADLQAAEQTLRIMGITQPDAPLAGPNAPEIPVLAPLGGEVVERLVGPGQVIQAGTTQVFTISNMNTVWVLANVYQHDLAYVKSGDEAAIQTDAYPDLFYGRISYIASALDPNTRTLPVRIVTNNPGQKLKKDMYVTATIQAGSIDNALTVPDAAVLRTAENQPFVYVAAGSTQFAQRLVTLGDSQDGLTQITGGLKGDERVVADGSIFLQFANSFQR